MRRAIQRRMACAVLATLMGTPAMADEAMRAAVDAVVEPLMAEHGVPGLSVAVLHDGERHVFHYGVASRETGVTVGDETLFEIGSLSKPFTGTLLARLEAEGAVDLSSEAQNMLPALAESPIGGASLLELLTYAAGGLPLQFPDGVNETNFAEFYRDFEPIDEIGVSRLYSNPSIGLAGHLAAAGAGDSFSSLMADRIFEPLGLTDTFLAVPEDRLDDYAQGYTRDNAAVRVNPGLFDEEAYGIKTTASDFLRFVEASIDPAGLDADLQAGLSKARNGVYRVDAMHQGLGWELYGAPARLDDLLQGADTAFVLEPNRVERPASPVTGDAVGAVSKTGSTGGFGAYALFQPERGTAIVLLANRFWPNPARIEAAHAILAAIDPDFVMQQ
ncbi:MAG: class C beta-lactamase [Aurantimonas endophytica]|uniref:class C beta-lactamase n=1 Tax=Aurantimonas endophytica TaxID=1522175 RepID=UPI003001D932